MQIATVFRVCFIAGIITFSSANFTQAQSSRQISYQGVVTQGDAKISDGWYSLTFALYGSVGSSVPLWQEEQRVYFQHGLFNVMLGAEFPLPERLPEDAWIGISFQGSGEFTRTKLTAVPYAMQAGIAEKAMYAEKAGELEGGVVSSINGIQGNVLMKASDGLEIRTDEEGGLIVGLSNEKRYEGILNQGTEWLLAGNTNANASSWLGTSNNFPLVIRTNNTERMRILSSNGNIGMGTTSPAERLHIVGNAQVDGNIVIKPTSSTSGELRIMENGGTQYTAFKSPQLSNNVIYTLPINDGNIGDVLTSDGSGVLSWQSVDGWGLSGNVVGAGKFIGTLNAQPLSFRTNNAERMSIGTTGNVAIGDETTSSKLTVAQSLFITNTGGTPEIKIEAPNNTTSTILKTTNQNANIVYTLPPDDGNNGQFLRTNGSGVLTWADAGGSGGGGGGGGLTHFSETRNTAAPNAAGPAHRIQPFGTEASIDFVLSPKGFGAIMAEIPDGSSIGGNKRGAYAVDWQMSRGNANEVASGDFSVIGGGRNNTASGVNSFVGGGLVNTASGGGSSVGGGSRNTASGVISFVGGGYFNTASGYYSFVGSGSANTASGDSSFVGGGRSNTASGGYSFVGGGWLNNSSSRGSTVSGGRTNASSGNWSTVGGGIDNVASNYASVVSGGSQNTASGYSSTVGGGRNNTASGISSFVGGGEDNTASGSYSFVGGARNNTASGGSSFVGGGEDNTASGGNSFIGGGYENTAGGAFSSISGGRGLTLDANANRSFGFHANNVDGTRNMTISAANTAVFGNVDLWLANNDNSPRSLRFYEQYNAAGNFPNGANYVGLRAPNNVSADMTYTLPASAPTSNGQVLSSTTAGVLSWITHSGGGTVTMGGDLIGSADNAQIVANAVGSNEISDNAVTTSKIADGNITLSKISQSGATNGQVLKWNGSAWSPSVDANTEYSAGTGISISSGIISSTGDTDASDDIVVSSTAGGDVSGTFSNLQIVANAVGSNEISDNAIITSKIADGNITLSKISQSGATNGQVLKWNGGAWSPSGDNSGMVNFSETRTVSAPNETRPVHQFSVVGSEANIDMALSPKGEGALTAHSADASYIGGDKRGQYAVDWQRSRVLDMYSLPYTEGYITNASNYVASGNYSVIAGGANNAAIGDYSNVGGGFNNIGHGLYATISGGNVNMSIGDGAAIGGGEANIAEGVASVIGGGVNNYAKNEINVIAGGYQNISDGLVSTISGGQSNTTNADYTTVSGGQNNHVNGAYSTIIGGNGLTLNGTGSIGYLGNNDGSRDMAVNADNTAVLGNLNLWIINNDNTAHDIRMFEASNDGDNYTAFKAQAQSTNITYTLPASAPTSNGQVLSSTTAGVLSWITPSGGGTVTMGGDLSGSADNAQIVANAVGSNEISDNAILTSKIADGNITLSKISQSGATNGQVLKWNGSGWSPSDDANTEYSAGTGISISSGIISSTGDTDASDDIVVSSTAGGDVSGTFSNLQIVANAVGSAEISNNAVTTSKIADGNITLSKISQSGATNGQVLKWNGSVWSPSVDANTEYSAGTGISISSGIISSTGDTDASDDIVVSSTSGGDVSGTFSNLQIIANAVGSAEISDNAILTSKIADGNITLSKISQSGATNGQVLKWNGSAWSPSGDNSGMVNFSETRTVSAPNETRPVHQFSVVGSEANIDMALSPKGEGALTAHSANNSLSGGNKRGQYAVDFQTVRSAATQVASGSRSSIGGGEQNTASGGYSRVGGGYANIASGSNSVVSGGLWNTASSLDAVISGGRSNTASGTASTVAGGESNLASAEYSFVGGGVGNQATGARSSVLGGYNNRSQSSYSVVLGGTGMTLNGAASNSFGFLGANAGNNNMTIAAANTGVLGNVNLWLANNDGNAREIRFYEPNSATGTFPATGVFYTAFKAQAQDSSYTYTLPSSAPISNGQVLTASTGGTMSWATKSLKITVNNFDPDEVNAASFANFTVTANGVTTTDVISLHRVGGFGNLIVASAYVNTNNQVTIRVYNPTASPVNLGAENIIIGVIRE